MKKHKKLSIILIIFLVIIFCNIAYYFITSWQNFSIVKKFSPASSSEAADLKTYSNSKMGFEVKYPALWFVKESGDTIEINPTLEGTPTYFSVEHRNDFKSLDEVKGKLSTTIPLTPVQINNASGFEYSDSASYEVIWLSHSDKIYTVRVYTSLSSGTEASQILSTFKFTD